MSSTQDSDDATAPAVHAAGASGSGEGTPAGEGEAESPPAGGASLYVHFMLDRLLPKSNITVRITPEIANTEYPPIVIRKENQRTAVWEINSGEYVSETSFSYTVDVEVTGPAPSDAPITWKSEDRTLVALPAGAVREVDPLVVPLPLPPSDEIQRINTYIVSAPS